MAELTLRRVLYEPATRIDRAFFPVSGLVSVVTITSDGTAVETSTIGPEGVIDICAFLGSNLSSSRFVVLIPGQAAVLRVSEVFELQTTEAAFEKALRENADYQLRVARQTAGCNSQHSLLQRLCRWLLTLGDHTQDDVFPITEEFLAAMLGSRRAPIGQALVSMARARLVEHGYGRIRILNRSGLADASCECYEVIRQFLV